MRRAVDFHVVLVLLVLAGCRQSPEPAETSQTSARKQTTQTAPEHRPEKDASSDKQALPSDKGDRFETLFEALGFGDSGPRIPDSLIPGGTVRRPIQVLPMRSPPRRRRSCR
jgi:hypothetical protein